MDDSAIIQPDYEAQGPEGRKPPSRGFGDALAALLSRVSVGPSNLIDPAPDGAELEAILDAALRAPDHGRLRPWRLVLVRGAGREALGEVLATALATRDPEASAETLERERSRPLRAPLVIVAGARILPEHPVPMIEQLLAAGAGVMNMLNAVHALGYGGMWLTGRHCYDPMVAEALGFSAPDRLLGFVHVGTPKPGRPAPPDRPERAKFVREWSGPTEASGRDEGT